MTAKVTGFGCNLVGLYFSGNQMCLIYMTERRIVPVGPKKLQIALVRRF